ncbi:MAG: polysaccharide biosynthesis tyrosine autokinase, partial [Acutalibacteraceae bacterium]
MMQEDKINGEEQAEETYVGNLIRLDVLIVDLWKAFKKFWWTALIFVLAFSSLTVYKCKKEYVPIYIAKASFSVSAENTSSVASGASSYSAYYNAAATQQLSKTFSYIINSSTMKTILLRQLNTPTLNGTITATNEVESAPIFTIQVQSTNPQDAYNILTAVMENYPRLAQYVVGETQLKVFSEPKVPEEPSNTLSYKREVIIAAAVGLVLSAGIMFIYAFTRNTIRKRDDIKEKLNRRCLVEVPLVKQTKRSVKKNGFVTISPKYPAFSEAFRYLSRRITNLLNKNGEKTLAFTSTYSGEGKTTTCYNLAYAVARTGKKVCLIDFDITKKNIQKSFAKDEKPVGVAEFLNGEKNADEILQETEFKEFKLIFAGTQRVKRKNYSQIGALIDFAKEHFDYVFVDAPPCLVVTDAAGVFSYVDQTVFVLKQDYTAVKKVRQAMKFIHDIGCNIAGVVFNAVGEGFAGYKDSYYSGYGYQSGRYGYYGRKYGRYGNYGY